MKARLAIAGALIGGLALGAPAQADTGEADPLRAVPPASTTAEIAPVSKLSATVYEVVPRVWGIIQRSENLAGDTWREASDEAERFTLKGDVFFEIDESDLTPRAEEELETIVEELAGVAIAGVEVGGHTDTVGTDAHNDRLSTDRAETVASLLQDNFDEVEVTAEGYGRHRLLAAEEGSEDDVQEARSRNRRVEITVTYLGEN